MRKCLTCFLVLLVIGLIVLMMLFNWLDVISEETKHSDVKRPLRIFGVLESTILTERYTTDAGKNTEIVEPSSRTIIKEIVFNQSIEIIFNNENGTQNQNIISSEKNFDSTFDLPTKSSILFKRLMEFRPYITTQKIFGTTLKNSNFQNSSKVPLREETSEIPSITTTELLFPLVDYYGTIGTTRNEVISSNSVKATNTETLDSSETTEKTTVNPSESSILNESSTKRTVVENLDGTLTTSVTLSEFPTFQSEVQVTETLLSSTNQNYASNIESTVISLTSSEFPVFQSESQVTSIETVSYSMNDDSEVTTIAETWLPSTNQNSDLNLESTVVFSTSSLINEEVEVTAEFTETENSEVTIEITESEALENVMTSSSSGLSNFMGDISVGTKSTKEDIITSSTTQDTVKRLTETSFISQSETTSSLITENFEATAETIASENSELTNETNESETSENVTIPSISENLLNSVSNISFGTESTKKDVITSSITQETTEYSTETTTNELTTTLLKPKSEEVLETILESFPDNTMLRNMFKRTMVSEIAEESTSRTVFKTIMEEEEKEKDETEEEEGEEEGEEELAIYA